MHFCCQVCTRLQTWRSYHRRRGTRDLSAIKKKKLGVVIAMTTDSFLWFYSIQPTRRRQLTQGRVSHKIVSSHWTRHYKVPSRSQPLPPHVSNKSTGKTQEEIHVFSPGQPYLVWWPPHCRWQLDSPPPPPRVAPDWCAAPCCWLTGSASSCPGRWAGLRAARPHLHSEGVLRGTAPLEVSECRRSYLRTKRAFVLEGASEEGSQVT